MVPNGHSYNYLTSPKVISILFWNKPDSDEVVTLDYDSSGLDGYASIVIDRLSAPQNAEVHLEIFDQALNIDPTNEDIVIFSVQNRWLSRISQHLQMVQNQIKLHLTSEQIREQLCNQAAADNKWWTVTSQKQ